MGRLLLIMLALVLFTIITVASVAGGNTVMEAADRGAAATAIFLLFSISYYIKRQRTIPKPVARPKRLTWDQRVDRAYEVLGATDDYATECTSALTDQVLAHLRTLEVKPSDKAAQQGARRALQNLEDKLWTLNKPQAASNIRELVELFTVQPVPDQSQSDPKGSLTAPAHPSS